MIWKIALKNGVLFGSGFGEEVDFKGEGLTIETFNTEEAFLERLRQLRG